MEEETKKPTEQASGPVGKDDTQPADKQAAVEQASTNIEEWQTKLDEAKLQMHLGAKEAQEELQPYVEQLEDGLRQAKDQWQKLEQSSEGAWGELEGGIRSSLETMQGAFEKAKQHFQSPEKK